MRLYLAYMRRERAFPRSLTFGDLASKVVGDAILTAFGLEEPLERFLLEGLGRPSLEGLGRPSLFLPSFFPPWDRAIYSGCYNSLERSRMSDVLSLSLLPLARCARPFGPELPPPAEPSA